MFCAQKQYRAKWVTRSYSVSDTPVKDGNALSTVKISILSVQKHWISWISCYDTITKRV